MDSIPGRAVFIPGRAVSLPGRAVLVAVGALCLGMLVIAVACSPPAADPTAASGSEVRAAPPDPAVGEVLASLRSARTASIRQRLSLVVPDDAGASTFFEISARLDRSSDRAEGALDAWADDGEESTMSTWPADLPRVSWVRIIDDTVHMRFGGDDVGAPWRDVTVLGDTPPVVAHLRSTEDLVVLLADAVEQRPPEGRDGEATWQGTVPPSLLGDAWHAAGPIGSVVRTTSGMPVDLIDDVHVYEVADLGGGTFRLSLWLDLGRLARNVGEPVPPEAAEARVDATWSRLDAPVEIDDPSHGSRSD
jgi:hypothetical protein